MAEQLIISISGLRGVVGENLTASVACEYGRAFGAFLKNRHPGRESRLSVCVGRDTRPSGQMLQSALTEGLCAGGINVTDLGVVTTPGVGIMAQELRCNGGAVVTASHNPAKYNGIKLLLDNSMAPPPDAAGQIKKSFLEEDFHVVDSSMPGGLTRDDRTDIVHIAKVVALIDTDAVAARKFRVALDSVNGAGGRVTKKLLAGLGCEVCAINDEPTGVFAHTPEPTAENVTVLCDVVRNAKADIGFAQDPDADRLAIVDESGKYIGEEYTLALAAKYAFSKGTGEAATNLSTSRMIDEIAARAGGKVIRTPVGEANVAAAMLGHDCIIGGEGNGGVIDLRVSPIRDSLVGIVLVLQLLAETGKTVSQLIDEIPRYRMIKDKFSADSAASQRILDMAKKVFAGAEVDVRDGCRFDFEDGWLHLRASNTEPVMRVIAEARDEGAARGYVNQVLSLRKAIPD
ncbi:MAG TPA: phosphoglucosamine mutase [Sedimentisphaerales bacterium]|nr:phosphoglucosamine mutase [Sedimentisphaerales bacterium]